MERKSNAYEQEQILIDRVFKNYDCKEHLNKTQYHLQESFKDDALACLICIENLERKDAVWNCSTCFSSFHLSCIQKWAKDSIFLQSQAEEENNSYQANSYLTKKKKFLWSCPKCRYEYPEKDVPYHYLCFCGKVKDPLFDPWVIPHSCGEKCKKPLRPQCGHQCLLLCHPGPCPPCPVMVKSKCHCSKSEQTRRCSTKHWSCNKSCNRKLDCGLHKCKDPCHPAECDSCTKVTRRKCQCGSKSEARNCTDVNWQCDKVCGGAHSCGHHKCEQICHRGPCGGCPQSKERSCPCGKQMTTLPCTETVLSCGDTCYKELACGIHICYERCHRGACPTCLQFLEKKCQCGAREKKMACSKVFTCEIKCKKLRDCKKHGCNRKCCTGDCPPCEHPCGKTLQCGQHKCESRCHRGRCFPCTITHTISCICGGTSVTVPCGRERKTPIPRCNLPCKKSSSCHHATKGNHKCHEGRCPQCELECGIKLNCKHKCLATCHDAVPVTVVENRKPAGPWEKVVAPQVKISKLQCPPCKVLVPGTCLGLHETSDWACSDLRAHSCGRKCGRQLKCGNHTCMKECHKVEGAADDISHGRNCQSCERPCSEVSPVGCTHRCPRECHPDPCELCSRKVSMHCHCRILKVDFKCHEWLSATDKQKERRRSCGNQCTRSIACGHICHKTCHSGDCVPPSSCKQKVAVRCPCRRLRKEFPCPEVSAGKISVACDEVCSARVEAKKKKEEEERMKQEREEAEKSAKELEEFERFMKGAKKKKKKRDQNLDNMQRESFLKKHLNTFLITSLVIAVLSFLTYKSI